MFNEPFQGFFRGAFGGKGIGIVPEGPWEVTGVSEEGLGGGERTYLPAVVAEVFAPVDALDVTCDNAALHLEAGDGTIGSGLLYPKEFPDLLYGNGSVLADEIQDLLSGSVG